MKIERDGVRAPSRLYRPADTAPRPASNSGHPAVVPGDQVSVSEEARHASSVREKLAAQPQVRAELVARIKTQIATGNYHVHSRALAEKLIQAKVLDE